MWCIIKQKYNAVSASSVTAMHAISMIVASQVQTVANAGLRPGTYDVTDPGRLCNWSLLVCFSRYFRGRRRPAVVNNSTRQLHRRMLSDGVKRSPLTFPSINDRRRERSKFSHKNLITGYTFLKAVTGFRTGNRLTGSRLTSLVNTQYGLSCWVVVSAECDVESGEIPHTVLCNGIEDGSEHVAIPVITS